jgi:hypothetical protein
VNEFYHNILSTPNIHEFYHNIHSSPQLGCRYIAPKKRKPTLADYRATLQRFFDKGRMTSPAVGFEDDEVTTGTASSGALIDATSTSTSATSSYSSTTSTDKIMPTLRPPPDLTFAELPVQKVEGDHDDYGWNASSGTAGMSPG